MDGRDGGQDDGGAASPCVIDAGFSKCRSCGRHIPARVVFENGFTYLLKDCPFEQKSFKELLFKGKWTGSRWKRIPSYWFRTAVGENHGLGRDEHAPNRPILSLILGAECSSRCRICRFINWRADKERPAEFDLAAAKKAISAHRGKTVSFCMAEPTENPFLSELVAFASGRGFATVLSTNGLRLSDRSYLKSLQAAGLKYIYMSFDGFDENIYEKIRGGKHQYYPKLKALENIKKEKIKTGLRVVLVRNINDAQVASITQYALNNSFVTEVSFQSLSLGGAEEICGFTKDNLLSVEDIKILVGGVLHLSADHFACWNEIKIGLAAVIAGLPFIRIFPFEFDTVYLLRQSGRFVPLLNESSLLRIALLFRKGGLTGLLGACFYLSKGCVGFLLKKFILKWCVPENAGSMVRFKVRVMCASPSSFDSSGRVLRSSIITP
ncbi:MAG: radical SAM protein [Elusimicrobia bacterium]|nr:radical SAM protein [Elusimicrobiota bacterium]